MYIDKSQGLSGWGGWSKLTHVVKGVVAAPVGIARAAVTGKSISGAVDQYVTQPAGNVLRSPGVVEAIGFVPGIGTALSIAAQAALALDALRKQKAAAAKNSAEEAAIDREIAAIEAKIKAMRAAPTANAKVGKQSATNSVPLELNKFITPMVVFSVVSLLIKLKKR